MIDKQIVGKLEGEICCAGDFCEGRAEHYTKVNDILYQALADQRTQLIQDIEEVFDPFRSSNQVVDGKRRFGVGSFEVSAREIHKEIMDKLIEGKE